MKRRLASTLIVVFLVAFGAVGCDSPAEEAAEEREDMLEESADEGIVADPMTTDTTYTTTSTADTALTDTTMTDTTATTTNP